MGPIWADPRKYILKAGAGQGFLDRGLNFLEGRVDLKIVPGYFIFYADFSEISHENGIILS